LEANYGFGRCVEAGPYFGLARYWYWGPIENNIRSGARIVSPFLGLQSNFHVLPLLIKKNDFRFDIYLTAKYGTHYFNVAEGSSPQHGFYSEYGLGLGIAFYLFKHMGFYTEYSIGKYSYYTDSMRAGFEKGLNSNLRFGVTFKCRNQSLNKNE